MAARRRAAFVMDRAMRAIGLPGKSFVPLIIGFGCNVPAIMATRTLDSRHDRVLTVMMAPFMSCGARLPVHALVAAVFFPESGQNLVFGLYLIGMAAAVGTGLLLKNTVLGGILKDGFGISSLTRIARASSSNLWLGAAIGAGFVVLMNRLERIAHQLAGAG